MEGLADSIFLSRLQLGFTLAFHIIFPTLTIGLSVFLVYLQAKWLITHDHAYMQLFRFWLKVFALGFGVGVVSGIVLSFEFGTNFNEFSRVTGNVLAPLLSYEVLMAFFLEATFLPILLFGWGRVGPRLHFFATIMVSLGTILSAFWILAANSWMQTPSGHEIRNGIFYPIDWWDVIFNPSFPFRFAHMLMASLVTCTFVVAGVAAWYLLKGRHPLLSRKTMSIALWSALVLVPLQVLIGDLHGLNTLEHQPIKIAAIEGLWQTGPRVPYVIFGLPDQSAERNHFELVLPRAGSLILRHDAEGVVQGLDMVHPQDRPHVAVVFWAFRVMFYIGVLFLVVVLIGYALRRKNLLYEKTWFLRLLVACAPMGFVAVIAGWMVTEVGRQPWIVQGLLRTANTATPLPWLSVASSMIMFLAIYIFLLGAFLYFLHRIVEGGPEERVPPELVKGAPLTSWYPPPRN